ncbi:type IVB secretion system protein IcmH/DotU [Desulfovibrio porci]|uniref:type IVB secretion system protein IcmH/DotU n=1 Tax=Desulfovibrio porci TaxID=2605782 RepID=UPI003A904C5B
MSQQTPASDLDKTVVLFAEESRPKEAELPFTAVAVAPGRQAPRHAPYLAQQTSLDEYTPGLNPLVNAASPLLLEIVRLREAGEADLEALRLRLEAEIRGFSAQAAALGVSEAQVNAAQYLLCTALDESVTTSSIPGAQGDWQHHSLLSTFHQDTWGGEIFFDVLSRTMEQPASRLYLLELIYLLLSLGFEGKYRLQDRGPLALESLRDQIYRQISLLRGEASPDLAPKISVEPFKNKTYAYVPFWLIAAVMVFSISVMFWGFSHSLSGKADPLIARFEQHVPTGAASVPLAAAHAGDAAPAAARPPAAEGETALPAPDASAAPATTATPTTSATPVTEVRP